MKNDPNQKTIQIYRIEYKVISLLGHWFLTTLLQTPTNSFKLITDSYTQEDVILRTPRAVIHHYNCLLVLIPAISLLTEERQN